MRERVFRCSDVSRETLLPPPGARDPPDLHPADVPRETLGPRFAQNRALISTMLSHILALNTPPQL